MNPSVNNDSFGESRNPGFTLIELVLVMTLLIMVLSVSYGLIVDCLEADRTIETLTTPEKVGEGILALMRDDISGTIWRHLGTQVFFIHDNGRAEEARDEIRFLSTTEPTPIETPVDSSTAALVHLRTITGVSYFLRQNEGFDGATTYTLFRKEIVDFYEETPLDSPGVNYEIYNKMAYLSIECYDGWSPEPIFEWDSERQIEWEETELEAMQENEGIGRVSDDRNAHASAPGAPGVPLEDSMALEAPPPAAIPRAVYLEIGFYTGTGDRIERDPEGAPILRSFSTIVPILTSQRVALDLKDDHGPNANNFHSGLEEEEEEEESPGSITNSRGPAAAFDPKRPKRPARGKLRNKKGASR